MPGVLVAFWILIGLGGGLTLSDSQSPIWAGPDSQSKSNLGKPCKPTYYATSAPAWNAFAKPDRGGQLTCKVVYFAHSTCGIPTRIRIGGEEQTLDTSWTYEQTIAEDFQHGVRFTWLSPVTGKILHDQWIHVNCWRDPGITYGKLYNPDGTLKGYGESNDSP